MALKNTDDKTNAQAKSYEAPVTQRQGKVPIQEALENLREEAGDHSNASSPQSRAFLDLLPNKRVSGR
ncbi:hypothetical protein [Pseudomonas baetica]|uniref:hypothetical protein n=1 Tax=Pseudomonas baetica TaxID=674054 RepID=UPI002870FFDF|nr:hypothetical protein [Pseudomonas baetica]MDR9861893.1 hypothetical protein [Pseudomonas baetica]